MEVRLGTNRIELSERETHLLLYLLRIDTQASSTASQCKDILVKAILTQQSIIKVPPNPPILAKAIKEYVKGTRWEGLII